MVGQRLLNLVTKKVILFRVGLTILYATHGVSAPNSVLRCGNTVDNEASRIAPQGSRRLVRIDLHRQLQDSKH